MTSEGVDGKIHGVFEEFSKVFENRLDSTANRFIFELRNKFYVLGQSISESTNHLKRP